MRNIWLPLSTIVITLFTLIGTANADGFSMALPGVALIAEPISTALLGAGLFGAGAVIRHSTAKASSDDLE